jgi:hypothetical protein
MYKYLIAAYRRLVLVCNFIRSINKQMKNLVRAILAGIGAKKIGGGRCGCIGTIIVFLILYWLLGYVFKVF